MRIDVMHPQGRFTVKINHRNRNTYAAFAALTAWFRRRARPWVNWACRNSVFAYAPLAPMRELPQPPGERRKLAGETMKKQHCDPDKLEQGCERLGIALSVDQGARLRRHLGLLAKWNRRLNLTSVNGMDDMVVRHLLDSLAIARFVRGRSLLDIGSGGGFPGMPLAIVNPRLKVTLLDSRGRRIEFLRYVRAALSLGNVSVARGRVEDYRPAEKSAGSEFSRSPQGAYQGRYAQKFDTLAVRAFASLGDTLKATAALHRPGARLLAMKGRMPAREIACLDSRWRERMTVEKLHVPFLAAERHLIIIEF